MQANEFGFDASSIAARAESLGHSVDGYEVARRIRQNPALASITLIALTGYGRDSDRQEALVAGFDHHLVKPVDADALKTLVARLGGRATRNGNGTRPH